MLGLSLLGTLFWAAPAVAEEEAPSPTPSPSSDRDHPALALLARWARDVETGDFEDMDRIWSPKAVVFVSGHATVGWAEFRDAHIRPQLARLRDVRYVVEDAGGEGGATLAWVIFRFHLTATLEGRPLEVRGLGTAILRGSPDGWRIVHLHTSNPLPLRPPTQKGPAVSERLIAGSRGAAAHSAGGPSSSAQSPGTW